MHPDPIPRLQYTVDLVPDIAMSHRNVQPHVSIKCRGSLLLEREDTDGVQRPLFSAPHQCSRVNKKKRSGCVIGVTYVTGPVPSIMTAMQFLTGGKPVQFSFSHAGIAHVSKGNAQKKAW